MNECIKVGVFDWADFPAEKGFYPDDLPAEWKLAYYSNEFDSACLSLPVLAENSNLLLESIEDLAESFELSLLHKSC